MRKLGRMVLALFFVAVSMNCIAIVEAKGLTPEQIIIFKSTYNKDGKFVMPVDIGADGSVSANITDSNNNVKDTFTTFLVKSGNTNTYSCSFSGVKSGTYYLNVKFIYASSYGLGEKEFTRRLKITHNGPAPKLAFDQTYQTYTDSGNLVQVFKLNYFNANGKKINFELYDEYGSLVHKGGLVAKHVNGSYTYNWNYFPSQGGLRVSNGIYILKYWIQGQTPNQINFEVNVSEG